MESHINNQMPLSYTIDKAARLVTIEFIANPSFAEFERMMLALFDDPDFAPGFKILSDRRRVEGAATTEYMKRAIHFLRDNQSKFSYVASVVKDDAAYGMARMGQMLAEDVAVHMQVFKDLSEAKQWLQSY